MVGGEIPSARFGSPSLHFARQVLVIWPTSQFGPWRSAKKFVISDGLKNEGSLVARITLSSLLQRGGLTQHQLQNKRSVVFTNGFLPTSAKENSDQCIDVDHPIIRSENGASN